MFDARDDPTCPACRLPRFRHVVRYDRSLSAGGPPMAAHYGRPHFSGTVRGCFRHGAVALAAFLALAVPSGAARADEASRSTVVEENDSIYFNSDKHYTQGLRLSYLGP